MTPPDLITTLAASIDYADENDMEIPVDVRIRARRLGAIKAIGDLVSINKAYHDAITQALISYFESKGPVTGPRNAFRRAMVDNLGAAFDLGWLDGGGDGFPSGDALNWLNARIEAEFGYIDELFVQAKELRQESDSDYFEWVTQRADGYTRTVSAFYNSGVMYGMKGRLLTWNLGRTEQHCDTCSSLHGQRHRASWYLARNYIPRKPGADMECGGYRCDCRLTDNKDNVVTI